MVSDFLQPDGVSHITETCGGPATQGTFTGPLAPELADFAGGQGGEPEAPKVWPAIVANSSAEWSASRETRRGGSSPCSQVTVPGQ